MSLFVILGVLGLFCCFHSIFDRKSFYFMWHLLLGLLCLPMTLFMGFQVRMGYTPKKHVVARRKDGLY